MNEIQFINLDNKYLVNKKLSHKLLIKCINYINNQISYEKKIIHKNLKNGKLKKVNLSKEIYNIGVDVIIKTKFNKDFKFINLKKSIIFFKKKKNIQNSLNKINEFKNSQIFFFPQTQVYKKFVFQKLASGKINCPKKLSNFDRSLLKNIFIVIDKLSRLERKQNIISNYLKKLKYIKNLKKNDLNYKIIESALDILKKNQKKKIITSITHGDYKLEHLYLRNNKIEYVIDWENISTRSIFFDLFNFFIPWFTKRSYNLRQIKAHISKFTQDYLPGLHDLINNQFEIYFSLYILERYERFHYARTSNFNPKQASARYNLLFKSLIKDLYNFL